MAAAQEIEQRYRTSSTIVIAMIAGQLLFAAVAWFVNQPGSSLPSTLTAVQLTDPLILAWIMVTAGSVFGALYFRLQITGSRSESQRAGAAAAKTPSRSGLQSRIFIMWALLEASGLMGVTLYFLNPEPVILSAALVYIAGAALVFFPRREWFDALHTT